MLLLYTGQWIIFIPEETIRVTVGNRAEIRAGLYSSHGSPTLLWYHENQLISSAYDARLSISQEEGISIVNISRVAEAHIGSYEGVIFSNENFDADTVQLIPGM